MRSKRKIAVIGSGFGGLSAAIRLAALGHEVTIYEKLDKLGGRAYQYEKNGFKFDGGPTVITAPHQYDELFSLAGKNREDYFKLIPLDPFYRVFKGDGRYFDYVRDNARAEKEVARFSPSDVDGYRKFIQGTTDIFNWFHPFTEKTFPTFSSFARIFPHVLTTGTWRTMYDYAAQFVKDDFIRQVCSFHPLLVGGNPFDTPSIYGLIIQFEKEWGIHYAEGGTGAIVKGLGKLFEDCGGTIRLNTPVKEIIIRNKKAVGIRLEDGSCEEADEVVSNADVAFTMKNLIPRNELPAAVNFRLSTMEYSNSLVVHYFGTKKSYSESALQHHNLMLGDDYRKLMGDIFKRKKLGKQLGLYVHMPSRTDATISPEGCGSFYCLSLVPNLDGKIDWDNIMPEYTSTVMGYLEEKYLPGLSSNIIAEHAINPLHFRDTLNSYKGAAFSIKPSMMQSGYFRPQVQSKVFGNLYFVGAGAHPGAGVPAVLASGKIAAAFIAPEYMDQTKSVSLQLAVR
ncbi:MAG: phytoene dehydrogenase [Bacteroidota bacterium]|jgi:phytoene desaturase